MDSVEFRPILSNCNKYVIQLTKLIKQTNTNRLNQSISNPGRDNAKTAVTWTHKSRLPDQSELSQCPTASGAVDGV